MSLLKRMLIVTLKVLGGSALLIILVVALGIGYLLWESRNTEIEYEQFSVLQSNDEHYSLVVEIGNPRMPYGSHSVAVKAMSASGSEVIAAKNIKLANDGMEIDSDNITSHWVDKDNAGVCMRGDEQKDNYLLINLQSLTISEKQEECGE